MGNKNYYDILGVAPDADLGTIKSAWRKIALDNHPDRYPGDSAKEERFKQASEAYEVLKDPKKEQSMMLFLKELFKNVLPSSI